MISGFRQTFSQTRYFLIPLLLFWLFLGTCIGIFGYRESFAILNPGFHNPITDFLALYFTHLADGIILPFVILLFAWKFDKSVALSALACIFATGIIVQGLKYMIFDSWDRPPVLMNDTPEIVIVPDQPPHHNSFPSGHSASFTAGGIAFAWLSKEWKWIFQVSVGLFTIALCYTRIHLGVHFPGDVLAGSMIGGIAGMVIFALVHPPLADWAAKAPLRSWRKFSHWIIAAVVLFIALRFYQLAFLDEWIG